MYLSVVSPTTINVKSRVFWTKVGWGDSNQNVMIFHGRQYFDKLPIFRSIPSMHFHNNTSKTVQQEQLDTIDFPCLLLSLNLEFRCRGLIVWARINLFNYVCGFDCLDCFKSPLHFCPLQCPCPHPFPGLRWFACF